MSVELENINVASSDNGGNTPSSSLPIIVTDSGSSLPVDLSSYQEGDTFLNTSDKKIYKAEETITGYSLATGVTQGKYPSSLTPVSVDSTTGVASGFILNNYSGSSWLGKSNLDFRWIGDKTYKIHFKKTVSGSGTYNLLYIHNNIANVEYGISETIVAIGISSNKIFIQSFSYYTQMSNISSSQIVSPVYLLDTILEDNVEYFLTINKTSNGVVTTSISSTSYTENIIETKQVETGIEDVNTYSNTCIFTYGASNYNGSAPSDVRFITKFGDGFNVGQIYLGDSSGDFVSANIVLSWDSGTDITDKTEYADKTNGALYLYENSELVKIGGALKKKVYTISADNTSTLDVSSDFTKIVDVLKNGVELALTDDYTISSGVITFVTALSTTDKITVKGE